jgi:hypothetical protein
MCHYYLAGHPEYIAAQLVPDLYVSIIPPQTYLIPGTQTNTIGVVGSASWGPVNQPVIVSDMPSYVRAFGAPVNRKFDMGPMSRRRFSRVPTASVASG